MNYEKLAKQAKEPLLSMGSRGEGVNVLHGMLTRLGYKIPSGELGDKPADAYYGLETRQAVEEFQRSHKLSTDGVFGPVTRAAMWKALEALPVPIPAAEVKPVKPPVPIPAPETKPVEPPVPTASQDSALVLELARAASANVAPEAVRYLVSALLTDHDPRSTRDEWLKIITLAGGFITIWVATLGLLFAPSERIEQLGSALGWLGVAGAGISGAAMIRKH